MSAFAAVYAAPRIVFSYGFRPFFLLAGIAAIVPMATVVWVLAGGAWPATAAPLFSWHGHEMLFGFATAAIGGFLLTAVPSWTGTRAVSGYPLVLLVALWLIGRLASAPFTPPGGALGAALGVAFLPALAVLVAAPLVRARNVRNLGFLVLLGVLFAADVLWHARRFGWIGALPFDPLRLAVNDVLLLVVVVGGRIIPAFTRNGLAALGRAATVRSVPWVDRAAIAAAVAVLAGDLAVPETAAAGVIAAVAAALLAVRISGWRGWRTLDVPLLWVLHLGYAWLVVGLALKAGWLLGGFGWAANWLHALTLGAFGTMILAVTTRAALGHTGRPLKLRPVIVGAYLAVSLAALLRIFGPWALPGQVPHVLTAAIAAWVAAYGAFVVVYAPILLTARADGKPG